MINGFFGGGEGGERGLVGGGGGGLGVGPVFFRSLFLFSTCHFFSFFFLSSLFFLFFFPPPPFFNHIIGGRGPDCELLIYLRICMEYLH